MAILLLLNLAVQSDKTLAKLKPPREHPRLGFAAADLPDLREKIKREPWAHAWAAVESRADAVRASSLDPKDAFASSPRGQARRLALTDGLECLTFRAVVSENADDVKALAAFFEAFDPASFRKDLPDNEFMPHGEFLEGLAVALDWSWNALSDAARKNLRAIVEGEAKFIYDGFIGKKSWEASVDTNNHSMASLGGLGLAAIALWHEHPDARAWTTLVRDKAVAYLAASFDEDGAAYEGNLYGPFGLSRILPFIDALARGGSDDLLAGGRLEKIVDQFIAELVPGGGSMLPLNDTDGRYALWPGNLYLYARSGRARWLWETPLKRHGGGGGHTHAWTVLWETDAVKPTPPAKLVNFSRGVGLLTVRNGWDDGGFLAAFTCGKRVSGAHGQSDVGHFLIHARGQFLAADTGYSNEPREGTPQQSIGHNLVLVDGKGMAITGGGAALEGRMIQTVEKKTLVVAQADLAPAFAQKDYNPMLRAQRLFIALAGADPYVVIIDDLVKDAKEHDFQWRLHGTAASTFDLKPDRAVHASGDAALDVIPLSADASKVALATSKFPSGSFGEHPVLEINSRGRRLLTAVVLFPRAADAEPVAVARDAKGKLAFTVTRGASVDAFTLSTASDGRPAALKIVRKDGDKLVEQVDVKMK